MIVLKRSYSYHIRKQWEKKILPRSITQRCSPTLGSHLRSSPIETSGSGSLAQDIHAKLGIQQNISTAYHPQTDGQSKRTNQTVETYLWIFCNEQQTNWVRWLPLAQYALNSRPSHTTKISPFELLIGVISKEHIDSPRMIVSIQEQKEAIKAIRKQAQEAILHSQMLLFKETPFRLYKEGQNLRTTHPTHKLRAKRYGPFQVIKVLSHVAYQLQLPPSWKIHNVFHASYLSPFRETTEHGTNFIEPPPDIIDEEPEWEVERIIGR